MLRSAAIPAGHTVPEITDVADVASDEETAATDGRGARIPKDHSITFEHVTFRYDAASSRPPILEDISFAISDGETVAIVGPTANLS